METKHNPRKPEWTCLECGHLWPCEERKRVFRINYAGRMQDLYGLMWSFYLDAVQSMTVPVTQLHARFIGWTVPAYHRELNEKRQDEARAALAMPYGRMSGPC